jgi:hypothetical protein
LIQDERKKPVGRGFKSRTAHFFYKDGITNYVSGDFLMVVSKVLERLKKRDWRYHKATMQVHKEVRGFSQHFKTNFWTLAISTFRIATGLVWYDVWKAIIDELFPNRNTFDIKLFVAILVTLVAIFGTYVVTRLQKRNSS